MRKTIKTATLSISEEMRSMKVGDVVRFPTEQYNCNSIRSASSTLLVAERMRGMKWKTRLNFDDKCVEVTRIS